MTFFPIPDEFYADPQFLSASSAAVDLWARAGSWSAHHLTDGFVPAAALPALRQADDQAAVELVEQRVWRRARGGFQFVYWPPVASRSHVEAKRESNRTRQQKHRSSKEVPSRRDKHVTNTVTDSVTNGVSHSTQSSPVQEEIKTPPQPSVGSPPRKRGTRIPADFTITPEMVAWSRDRVPGVDGRTETEKFINYWQARTGKDATKLDWPATWRNWMLNAAERTPRAAPNGQRPSTTDLRVSQAQALKARYASRLELT